MAAYNGIGITGQKQPGFLPPSEVRRIKKQKAIGITGQKQPGFLRWTSKRLAVNLPDADESGLLGKTAGISTRAPTNSAYPKTLFIGITGQNSRDFYGLVVDGSDLQLATAHRDYWAKTAGISTSYVDNFAIVRLNWDYWAKTAGISTSSRKFARSQIWV